MNRVLINPFDSIESAHEFVALLTETALQSKRDIEADVQREASSSAPRRLEALRLALYNLEKLELHMHKSRRILNDLRSLRRLLFEERKAGASTPKPKAIATTKPEVAITAVVLSSVARVGRSTAGADGGGVIATTSNLT